MQKHLKRFLKQLSAAFLLILLLGLGILFVVPQFYAAFTGFLGRFTTGAQQAASDVQGNSLREQFLIGLLLALAWVPCSSPALIASTTTASFDVAFWVVYLRYFFFGLGAITFILVLGLGARSALMSRRNAIAAWMTRIKPVLGGLLIFMGVLILTGGVHWLETQLNDLGLGRPAEGFGTFLEGTADPAAIGARS